MTTRFLLRSALYSDRGRLPLLGWLLVTAVLLAWTAPVTEAETLAVVVNPSVSVNDLSFAEFRRIMLAERQFWTTGEPIALIVRAPVAFERTVLLERVYRMSEARYREYWIAKIFRGEASDGPRLVLSNEEALDLVGAIEGAITVIDVEDVPAGLKVLKLDGHLPSDDAYPLLAQVPQP